MILGRSMELYRTAGLEESIRSRASLFADFPDMARAESVAGQEWMRTAIEGLDEADRYSPSPWAPIDQQRLEPLLREHAVNAGAQIEFGSRLTDVDQDDNGITATIVDTATGKTRTIRADYLVATDGADSTVRERLGIRMRGPGTIGHYVNIVWQGDITGPLRGRRVGLWFLDHPRPGSVLMPQGDRGRWILMVPHDPATGEKAADFTDERCTEMIRSAVGLPELPIELVAMTGEDASPVARLWTVAACVADEFRRGRVFLVGDSAHLMPPAGAFGANLGIQDAHNLAWKLALVLRGQAGAGLLDSYAAERVPVADATVHAATSHLQVRSEAGGKGNTTGGNLAVIFGYQYRSAAVVADGTTASGEPELRHPAALCGQPGTRAPHVTLLRKGEQISSIDLYAGEFVLISGPAGQPWVEAARKCAAGLGVPLSAFRLGRELADPTGIWARAHRVDADGAVLVRPDGFVGWRAARALPDPERHVRAALTHLLAR